MSALSRISDKLSEAQGDKLVERARLLYDDDDHDIMIEARMLVTRRVDRWLSEAGKQELLGQLAIAESLYYEACNFMPSGRKARFYLGRFYYRTGRREQAFEALRESGSLLDVPRIEAAPMLDGRLDDVSWSRAAQTRYFETFSGDSDTSIPAEQNTTVRLMYTDEALFFGIYCEDDSPDSLVVTDESHGEGALQDLVEFFLKSSLDQEPICQVKINSAGTVVDGILPRSGRAGFDITWNALTESAAHVGADFWSAELKLPFEQLHFSRPEPGGLWACNMQRGYRRAVWWSQWTSTWSGVGWDESFGWLRFG